ncbi:MAG TPA: S8 family serine peptidase [Mycobacteriales bacterium]|nr:S8 family serine peptidase [Mycobacteriales bacterium]
MPDSRRSAALVAAVAAGALALSVTPALAVAPTGRPVTAVVALASTHPVTVPGVRLLANLVHVQSEVVSGTPDALARLAHAPGVLGIAGDSRFAVQGRGQDGSGDGSVFASAGLGGRAGSPEAGTGVNVAVLDTGLTDTPALNRASGQVTDGVDVSQLFNGGQAQTSGTFTDGYGHGTFLSSLIAGGPAPGSHGQALGVAPGARIVVVKVADDTGTTSLSEVLAGLDWVAAHARAIQVVNIALAQVRPMAPDYGADPLTAGIEHVFAAGVLPVVAVGNTPGQVGDPGDDVAALTVGAADTTGEAPRVADFSGSGLVAGVAKPDLVASGVHVLGEMPANSVIAEQNPQGWQPSGLFRGSGSSMATAIASGVAAIFFSEHRGASPLEAKASLRRSADAISGPTAGIAAGAGLLEIADRMLSADATDQWSGMAGFDSQQWQGNAWLNGSWEQWLASGWSGPAWTASTWSASTWSASTWSASTWSASTWSASTWSASTWSASTWSASTWSASTWSDESWGG